MEMDLAQQVKPVGMLERTHTPMVCRAPYLPGLASARKDVSKSKGGKSSFHHFLTISAKNFSNHLSLTSEK